MVAHHEARDVALLDAIDAIPRIAVARRVWRVVRDGRDVLQGSAARGRWSGDTVETLYTSLDQDGAIAEIHSLLSLQPVFPSKLEWTAHHLEIDINNVADLTGGQVLETLGVDMQQYQLREYRRTQAIADAASFLGFDGLLVPSARYDCVNMVMFTDRLQPDQLSVIEADAVKIDWIAWRIKEAGKLGRR